MVRRRARVSMPVVVAITMWLAASALVTYPARAAPTTVLPPTTGIVVVPKGIFTVLFGGQLTQQITCEVLPLSSVRVEMTALDGNGAPAVDNIVSPRFVNFASSNATANVTQTRSFTLSGFREGRFYLTYQLTGANMNRYHLSAYNSVVVVTDQAQGWQGIWYELAANSAIFMTGLIFFVWRRLHQVHLPIWQRHRAGLFERVNFDDLPTRTFEKRYREIRADTTRDRMRQYWDMACDGNYVCHTSGIPAALLLRFHVDAGHLCAILTFFSIGTLIPVNYLSGNSQSILSSKSFQQMTISNVPLYSDWLWVHVAYCYVVAALVLAFLIRQHALLSTLRRRTKRIVGGRSILIHAGLPASMTTRKLRALLAEYYDSNRIDDVTVVFNFEKLHHLLDRRQELAQELDRIRGLDAGYEHDMLSCNLLWCPGSVLLPAPTQVLGSYLTCRPCRYHLRHMDCHAVCRRAPLTSEERLTYSKVSSDREIVDSTLSREFDALDEELDFFPEEAVDLYERRKCIGAAFVVFDSAATRDDFVRLVREQTCYGRVMNAVHDRTYHLRYSKPPPRSPRRSVSAPFPPSPSIAVASPSSLSSSPLSPYLANLVLTSAPEPDDVLWKNLRYEPLSLSKIALFLGRQVTTMVLLLLFSTPTAVLVYIKLDSTSGIYRELYAKHSVLVSLFASYLPSLLLIVVNWCLLAFLFHVAMLEPSISDSRRTKSFLVNGFTYLIVSSVFLPSIGVTAAYLAFSELGANRKNYVESFLFKVSGTTFFISYICQRTFLGSIIELTRMGERLAYQPWVLSRSVTADERREARKPLPYYYGHDYAVLTSVLVVILLGTVITPILTPFGALFFYVKYGVVKYNFLYVTSYTPGRGHIAQTAYSLVAACLVIFELVMAFVFLQIAGRKQFAAMIVLLSLTAVVYFFFIADMSSRVKHKMSDLRSPTGAAGPLLLSPTSGKIKSKSAPPRVTSYQSPKASAAPTQARRTIFSPSPTTLEEELGLLESYTDPYKVALSVFKLLGVHEKFHSMSSSRTQLKYAFHRLKRNARAAGATTTQPLSIVPPITEEKEQDANGQDDLV